MIDVKAAVESTYNYLQYIQDLVGEKLYDLRLEEVELSEDKHSWLITLGYDLPVRNRRRIEELLASQIPHKQEFKREYKLFRVNSETGEVEAMKIRQV